MPRARRAADATEKARGKIIPGSHCPVRPPFPPLSWISLDSLVLGRLSAGELQAFGIEYESTGGPVVIPNNLFWKAAEIDFNNDTVSALGMSVIVDTETIPSGALYDFIERYLLEMEKDGAGKLPSKDRIHYAAGDLERLLNDTPCTPLLATMWAKEIGAPPQPVAFRPRGVASLIESYLRRILLPAANGNETLVDRLTKDASRIAERELGGRYFPGYITRATALEIIRTLDPSDPDKRFGLLERSRLLESTSQHSDTVHIAPDPLAEHLVARLRTDELGSDVKAWRSFIAQLRKQSWPVGFTAALVACVEDEVYGLSVPDLVRQQIKLMRHHGAELKASA